MAFWRGLLAFDLVLLFGAWLGTNLALATGATAAIPPRHDDHGILDATIAYLLFTGGAAFLCLRGMRGTSAGALRALGLLRPRLREFWRGLTWAGGLLLATVPLQLVLGLLLHPKTGPDAAALLHAGTGVVLAVSLLSAAGEEALFRGALLPRMGLHTQAILFGLLHVQYSIHWSDMILPPLTALAAGYAFAHLRRTGTLWGPLWAHAGFNLMEVAAGRLV
jgi:membrane protease YdiL (CAAX protease family)